MKRTFDIIFSLAGLIVLSPLLLLIFLLIKLSSKGPVFFRQERIGRHCKPFYIYKFRSMVLNAEHMGPYYTSVGDKRITPIGAFLRKTSLDEIPQLINVLIGDMSIVGPRPDVPVMEEQYTEEEWTMRHQVRPGITGLAQSTVRSAATPEERKRLDIEYVKKHSLFLDMKIMYWTFKQVLGKGSY